MKFSAVLFDLDGTLADTAPDLGQALNQMLESRGLKSVETHEIRAYASSGAAGLIRKGFGFTRESEGFEELRAEFLSNYEKKLVDSSKLFEGIRELLKIIDNKLLLWGVVTNKSHRYTIPVLRGLKLLDRAGCVVSGDTTAFLKPHPAPLIRAADDLKLKPSDCIYVGDDERDIKSAKSAGMKSVAALYGYLGDGSPPSKWGADFTIHKPLDLLKILEIE